MRKIGLWVLFLLGNVMNVQAANLTEEEQKIHDEVIKTLLTERKVPPYMHLNFTDTSSATEINHTNQAAKNSANSIAIGSEIKLGEGTNSTIALGKYIEIGKFGIDGRASGNIAIGVGYGRAPSNYGITKILGSENISIGGGSTITSLPDIYFESDGITLKEEWKTKPDMLSHAKIGTNETIAIGKNEVYASSASVALGRGNKLFMSSNSTVLGFGNTLGRGEGLGKNMMNSESSAIVGSSNYADGKNTSVFGFQNEVYGEESLAVGWQNMIFSKKSSGLGHGNNYYFYNSGIKIGDSSSSIGFQNNAGGFKSSSIGANNQVYTDYSNGFGFFNVVKGYMSNGFGAWNTIDADNANIFGTKNTVKAKGGLALGNNSTVEGISSIVIGNKAISRAENSIALGAYSMANRAKDSLGYIPEKKFQSLEELFIWKGTSQEWKEINAQYEVLSQAFQVAKDTYEKNKTPENKNAYDDASKNLNEVVVKTNKMRSSWSSTLGAISIGNEDLGYTRQLTGLAAGSEDTDAVNVAQLKVLSNTPISIYSGGTHKNTYTMGESKFTTPLHKLQFDFGNGLKAEEVTDADGVTKRIFVGLDKEKIKEDSDLRGPQGDPGVAGANGKDGVNGKDGKDGVAGSKGDQGDPGVAGTNGKDGKSAYEIWIAEGNTGTKEKFLESLKGKDGAGGKGTDGLVYTNEKGEEVYRKEDKFYEKPLDPTTGNPVLGSEIDSSSVRLSLNSPQNEKGKITKATVLYNVANGKVAEDSTEAINGSQLYQVKATAEQAVVRSQQNEKEIYKVKNEVTHVGSLSAALAALHPMQYDPVQSSQIMAGIGSYRDKQAVAVGLSHYFSENVMLTAGLSLGNENKVKTMANVGITWKLGKDENRKNLLGRDGGALESIYKMQETMQGVLEENKILKSELENLKKQVEYLLEKK